MTLRISRRALLGAAIGAGCAGLLPAHAAQRPLRAPVRLVDASMRDVLAARERQLVRQVMRDRVIALNFFFTGCSTVCPVQALALARAQKRLGKVMGTKVALVSISIDWFGDTEAAIRRFAAAHGAGPHWHFLKAPPDVTDPVREGFEAYAPQRDNHPPVLAIGRADSKQWSRFYGLPSGDAIADEIAAWLA